MKGCRKVTLRNECLTRIRESTAGSLVDGFKGSLKHREGFWVWFTKDLDPTIDLGKVTGIDSVDISVLQMIPWFLPPLRVAVSVSDEGHHYNREWECRPEPPLKGDLNRIIRYSADLKGIKGRYLNIRATVAKDNPEWVGEGPNLVLDEIIVH